MKAEESEVEQDRYTEEEEGAEGRLRTRVYTVSSFHERALMRARAFTRAHAR